MNRTSIGALVALAGLLGCGSALADGSLAKVKQAGKLVIATMPNYPPITYKDTATNKLTGFDIDLGEAIAAEMGVKAEWQEIQFAQMLPSLQTERVDTAMAGMSDTLARREMVDFVDYMRSGTQFYTVTKQAETIRQATDLCGRKVGASRSTNNPQRIAEWSKAHCEAKGKPAIEVIGTEGSVDARNQLKIQRIDASVQGNETLPYFQTLEPNTYVLLGEPLTEEITGLPVLKTKVELRDGIKAAMDRLVKNGTYAKLLDKYGLARNGLAEIQINAAK
ncbi:ABC transporter substrate-binding protein [Bosea minatitlanensis]|uniref:ABC transporter substrate-binding protein n=1 Tax=Bosea minatitlanensis TaxID=128782 RepID=A0ABW0F3U8_9HYPH|nr:ABC transporter substrate-binding protein [Bosea minatitlanensis]MCT4493741.1 ABC transporter substrate-binding protein [Bosea minatitlanensis]